MIAVILAAGMASRLRPLTNDRPKCLLEVGRRTLLQRTVDALLEPDFGRRFNYLFKRPAEGRVDGMPDALSGTRA